MFCVRVIFRYNTLLWFRAHETYAVDFRISFGNIIDLVKLCNWFASCNGFQIEMR